MPILSDIETSYGKQITASEKSLAKEICQQALSSILHGVKRIVDPNHRLYRLAVIAIGLNPEAYLYDDHAGTIAAEKLEEDGHYQAQALVEDLFKRVINCPAGLVAGKSGEPLSVGLRTLLGRIEGPTELLQPLFIETLDTAIEWRLRKNAEFERFTKVMLDRQIVTSIDPWLYDRGDVDSLTAARVHRYLATCAQEAISEYKTGHRLDASACPGWKFHSLSLHQKDDGVVSLDWMINVIGVGPNEQIAKWYGETEEDGPAAREWHSALRSEVSIALKEMLPPDVSRGVKIHVDEVGCDFEFDSNDDDFEGEE